MSSTTIGAKKKCVIIGLTPGQAGVLTRELGNLFDFHFWKDKKVERLKALCRNADFVLTSHFAPHKATEMAESVGAKVTMVHGGLSSIKERLVSLYDGSFYLKGE